MTEQKGLNRRNYCPTVHADCTFGRVVALYIFRKRKWMKIGEYCGGCGQVAIFSKFKEGI